jgi:hypothetical protein
MSASVPSDPSPNPVWRLVFLVALAVFMYLCMGTFRFTHHGLNLAFGSLKLLWALAFYGLVAGVLRIVHLLRANAMREFAGRLGFEYIGPGAPPNWLWNPYHFYTPPSLPSWISHFRPSGERIRQAWNVTKGSVDGVPVLIFDCVLGCNGGHPCTVITCHTEQDPFVTVTSKDRVLATHGWSVLHGSWFLWFSWTMGIKRLEAHLNDMKLVQRA